MDDVEFDVLDELYFVISYDELRSNAGLPDDELQDVLIKLVAKQWVRVYKSADEEIDDYNLSADFKSYYYLASKKGLLAHNRQ